MAAFAIDLKVATIWRPLFSRDNCFFFFQAEDGIRDLTVTGVQTCALPISFTASVTSPVTGTPTGTVTFQDGASALGTGTLSGGTATFTTSALTAGTHSIPDRKSVVEGKRVDIRGRRIIKKKKKINTVIMTR